MLAHCQRSKPLTVDTAQLLLLLLTAAAAAELVYECFHTVSDQKSIPLFPSAAAAAAAAAAAVNCCCCATNPSIFKSSQQRPEPLAVNTAIYTHQCSYARIRQVHNRYRTALVSVLIRAQFGWVRIRSPRFAASGPHQISKFCSL
jgi:hypothetical protein